MAKLYLITETILVLILIHIGERFGISNTYMVIASIILTHLVVEFLYAIRYRWEKLKKQQTKKEQLKSIDIPQINTESIIDITPVTDNIEDISERVFIRHFYDDVDNKEIITEEIINEEDF